MEQINTSRRFSHGIWAHFGPHPSSALGPARVLRLSLPRLVGETFYVYAERVPSVFAFLGTGNPARPGTTLPSHHPRFDLDEDALAPGVLALAAATLDLLGDSAPPT